MCLFVASFFLDEMAIDLVSDAFHQKTNGNFFGTDYFIQSMI
jgi:hypothetical protein